jgi:hypothetical protein
MTIIFWWGEGGEQVDRFIYDGTAESRARLIELTQQGVPAYCPKCGSELIVAVDIDSAQRHKVHPGVYCSKTPRHFFELHELVSMRDLVKRTEK